jgi:hypothetical protein
MFIVQEQHFYADPQDEKQKLELLPSNYVAGVDTYFEDIARRTGKVEVQMEELMDVLHVGLCRHRGLLVYEVCVAHKGPLCYK